MGRKPGSKNKPKEGDALDALDEDFEGDETGSEEAAAAPEETGDAPEVKGAMSRKEYERLKKEGKAGKPKEPEIKLMDSYMRNKKGEVMKDEDGDEMTYAPGFIKQIGFVNENGVRFPVGLKYEGGHIGTFGNVILNRCPKCGHQQSIDDARTGKCSNERVGGMKKVCGFDKVAELEEFTLDDI